MQFLFLIRVDPDVELSDDDDPGVEPWLEEMEARGVRLIGNRLRPVEETKSVRVRSGSTLVSDGPFTEAKEVVAGFDLIDCADGAEALEIAAKHPVARFGAVEVRQLWPLEVSRRPARRPWRASLGPSGCASRDRAPRRLPTCR